MPSPCLETPSRKALRRRLTQQSQEQTCHASPLPSGSSIPCSRHNQASTTESRLLAPVGTLPGTTPSPEGCFVSLLARTGRGFERSEVVRRTCFRAAYPAGFRAKRIRTGLDASYAGSARNVVGRPAGHVGASSAEHRVLAMSATVVTSSPGIARSWKLSATRSSDRISGSLAKICSQAPLVIAGRATGATGRCRSQGKYAKHGE